MALRNGNGVQYLFGDHLGSTSIVADSTGSLLAEQRYTAWGEERFTSGTLATAYQYTGQRKDSSTNLYWHGTRWYDPSLGRFIQPDQIIPETFNPLAYDRYQYVYSNPIRYTDSSGHCIDGITTWACIAIAAGLVLKAVDYGWTAYDVYQSGKVIANPESSQQDKLFAGVNIGLAVIFEAGEPDDLLPVGLPLDDLGRKAVMKGAREAFEEGGEAALEKFIREKLGDYADEVLAKTGLLKPDPNKLHHIFDKPGRQLGDLVDSFGSQSAAYNAVFDEFSKVARSYTNAELNNGISVIVNGIIVTVRGKILDNGAVKMGTFFTP